MIGVPFSARCWRGESLGGSARSAPNCFLVSRVVKERGEKAYIYVACNHILVILGSEVGGVPLCIVETFVRRGKRFGAQDQKMERGVLATQNLQAPKFHFLSRRQPVPLCSGSRPNRYQGPEKCTLVVYYYYYFICRRQFQMNPTKPSFDMTILYILLPGRMHPGHKPTVGS